MTEDEIRRTTSEALELLQRIESRDEDRAAQIRGLETSLRSLERSQRHFLETVNRVLLVTVGAISIALIIVVAAITRSELTLNREAVRIGHSRETRNDQPSGLFQGTR